MMRTARIFACLILLGFLSSAANAGDYKFHLWNKTTKYKITGFQLVHRSFCTVSQCDILITRETLKVLTPMKKRIDLQSVLSNMME